jgi:hypothetical protein
VADLGVDPPAVDRHAEEAGAAAEQLRQVAAAARPVDPGSFGLIGRMFETQLIDTSRRVGTGVDALARQAARHRDQLAESARTYREHEQRRRAELNRIHPPPPPAAPPPAAPPPAAPTHGERLRPADGHRERLRPAERGSPGRRPPEHGDRHHDEHERHHGEHHHGGRHRGEHGSGEHGSGEHHGEHHSERDGRHRGEHDRRERERDEHGSGERSEEEPGQGCGSIMDALHPTR